MIKIPSFTDLFELDKIQKIQDSFAKATGVASIITDIKGQPITRPSNFCTLCMDIIRKTEKGLANCMYSDAVIGNVHPGGPIVQICLSGGLWDAGASISVAGQHIANWMIGQVRNENTEIGQVLAYAKKIDADPKAFEKAFNDVTVMSREQFTAISESLYLIANQLSDQAFQKITQTQLIIEKAEAQSKLFQRNNELQNAVDQLTAEIETKKRIEKDLKKQNEYMEALHETSLGMFSRIEISQVLTSIIKRASKLTGMPDGFFFISDSEQTVLEIKAGCGKFSKLTGIKLTPREGVSGKAWENGEPICVDNYQDWPGKSDQAQFDFMTSVIGVPLTSGSRIEGIIGLSHHEQGKTLKADTLKILEQFAELSTIAIDNARLFEDLGDELSRSIQLENEREEMEKMLRHAQKMEAVGTLAGGVAHDFNNILFPIIGFSEMIMQDLPEDSPIKKQLQPVINGAERAKNLVQQILTFSRETETDYKPLKIHLIIKEALNLFRASLPATIKIEKSIPPETKMVMADPTQIYQIVMNLITNASHAMEETGGKLSIFLKDVVLTDQNLPSPSMFPGQYACLEVNDTGTGMDTKIVKRIFDPYFTTKNTDKGTGLGLAVVHGIVKNLHGEIIVRSQEGKGSCFLIYLPSIVEKNKASNVETFSMEQFRGDEKILVVDDEKPILNTLENVLTRFGYTVITQSKSTDALEYFQRSPYEVDLVITDMTMPKLTGNELIGKIKEIRPDIPMILCTGFSEKNANGKIKGAKPDKIMLKPAGREILLKNIRYLLDN